VNHHLGDLPVCPRAMPSFRLACGILTFGRLQGPDDRICYACSEVGNEIVQWTPSGSKANVVRAPN
jgi:hypothetical protein